MCVKGHAWFNSHFQILFPPLRLPPSILVFGHTNIFHLQCTIITYNWFIEEGSVVYITKCPKSFAGDVAEFCVCKSKALKPDSDNNDV